MVVAVFWSTEAVPLEAASLLPVVLLPLLGILDTGTVARWRYYISTQSRYVRRYNTYNLYTGNTSPELTCSS